MPDWPGELSPIPKIPTWFHHDQWLRKWSLNLGGDTNNVVLSTDGIDNTLRMTFQVRRTGNGTPNTAIINVYNLSEQTAKSVVQEFNSITLLAGYREGLYGNIFTGTIKQYKIGRQENMTDTYLQIFAAEGDPATIGGAVNQTLQAKINLPDWWKALTSGMTREQANLQMGEVINNNAKAQFTLRDRPILGSVADEAHQLAKLYGANWYIEGDKIHFIGQGMSYGSEVIDVNVTTGMVGVPEETNDGITVTTLLNPTLRVNNKIRLNNADINRYFVPGGDHASAPWFVGGWSGGNFAPTSNDGIYLVRVIDYDGDTRGTPWYTKILCIAVDPSQPSGATGIGNAQVDAASGDFSGGGDEGGGS